MKYVSHYCVTMKTTNIRELKHDTATVLQWVQQGHAVEITRHHRVVAILTPPPVSETGKIQRPDFAARMKETWGNKQFSSSWTDLISDERGER